jgi:hypothetical protein
MMVFIVGNPLASGSATSGKMQRRPTVIFYRCPQNGQECPFLLVTCHMLLSLQWDHVSTGDAFCFCITHLQGVQSQSAVQWSGFGLVLQMIHRRLQFLSKRGAPFYRFRTGRLVARCRRCGSGSAVDSPPIRHRRCQRQNCRVASWKYSSKPWLNARPLAAMPPLTAVTTGPPLP